MRLIGGHDYYDKVQGLGYDDSVAFVRPKDMTLDAAAGKNLGLISVKRPFSLNHPDETRSTRARSFSRHCDRLVVDGVEIFFSAVTAYVCGKRYAGVEVCYWSYPVVDARTYRFMWNWESFREYVSTLGRVPVYACKGWENPPSPSIDPSTYFEHGPVSQDLMNRLISEGITIAICRGDTWRINGDNLGSIEFFKVMDPFTMFQEIDMWVSGVLPSGANPMVVITDNKIKIAKAGFDTVTSFRKCKLT